MLPLCTLTTAADADDPPLTLVALPELVVSRIFSLLHVDVRLRCREVCRGWRAALAQRSLWTHLDLTTVVHEPRQPAAIMANAPPPLYDALLRCAAACASGGLQSLDVSARPSARDVYRSAPLVSREALLEVAAANAGSLRELRQLTPGFGADVETARQLLAAAPLLRTLALDLKVFMPDAAEYDALRSALRNEAPFGSLRVSHLDALIYQEDEAAVLAFAVNAAAHASLAHVVLRQVSLRTPASVISLVDSLLAVRQLQTLDLFYCIFPLVSAPALMRLLGTSTLTSFSCAGIFATGEGMFPAGVLAAALRANTTLTALDLCDNGLFEDAASAAEVLGALHGHRCLRSLTIYEDVLEEAGEAFGLLIAADAPALTYLEVGSGEGDAGLSPLLAALPLNTHLRSLKWCWYGISEALVNDVLLPSVRDNSGLRHFEFAHDHRREAEARHPGVLEAEALVAQRPPAD
jgi:hypothetical protein